MYNIVSIVWDTSVFFFNYPIVDNTTKTKQIYSSLRIMPAYYII